MFLTIELPQGGWQAEKAYTAECILRHFLGCVNFNIRAGSEPDWVIRCTVAGGMTNTLNFPNLFFPESDPSLYLTAEHLEGWRDMVRTLPRSALQKSEFPENEIPLLFCRQVPMHVQDIDLFGTIFFYLSRYEEFITGPADEIDRFLAHQSIVQEFHGRPVVDEYIWLLSDELSKSYGWEAPCPSTYRLVLSHDVDVPHSWVGAGYSTLLRVLLGSFVKHRSLKRVTQALRSFRDPNQDPIFCFAWMLAQAESIGQESMFYFLTGGEHRYDIKYELSTSPMKALVSEIMARGHQVGLHGSIASATNARILENERQALERAIRRPVRSIRQHYLRFQVPVTWRAQQAAGLVEDSSLGYADRAGFRCGTARRFPVFDICAREALQVYETPLVCMEQSLLANGYQGLSHEEAYFYAAGLVDRVKTFGGNFTLLWHNHNLVTAEQRDLYQQILNYAS